MSKHFDFKKVLAIEEKLIIISFVIIIIYYIITWINFPVFRNFLILIIFLGAVVYSLNYSQHYLFIKKIEELLEKEGSIPPGQYKGYIWEFNKFERYWIIYPILIFPLIFIGIIFQLIYPNELIFPAFGIFAIFAFVIIFSYHIVKKENFTFYTKIQKK
jgi:hypothetical protein